MTWHPYDGSGCPVTGDIVIEVKTSTGIIGPCRAVDLSWDEGGIRILAWRETTAPPPMTRAKFWRWCIAGLLMFWIAVSGGVWAAFKEVF